MTLSSDDDDIEILEVVGIDEGPEGADSDDEGDGEDVVLSLDDDDESAPGLDESDAAAVALLEPLPAPAAAEPAATEERTPAGDEAARGKAARGKADSVSDRDRLLRMQADFENFKKRTERERLRREREATADLVKRMLPVLDNFERALCAEQSRGENGLRDGVVLIFRQILDELRKEGLKAIDAVGQTFDPAVHEAVETDTESGHTHHTVVEELQRGYTLGGRLLRPSLVKVAIDPVEQDRLAGVGEDS